MRSRLLKCSVSTCKNDTTCTDINGQPVHLHSIPIDSELDKVWIKLLNKDPSIKKLKVCSIHFHHTDFVRDLRNELLGLPLRKRLKPDAVPSLHLPHSDDRKIEQDLQRTARLREKQERRQRQDYLKQVREQIHPTQNITVTDGPSVVDSADSTFSEASLPRAESFQGSKHRFRLQLLKFINDPLFASATDFPTRAKYQLMLQILKQDRPRSDDEFEAKVHADYVRIESGTDGILSDARLARQECPEKMIFIADDFLEELNEIHDSRGHSGCYSTIQTLKEKYFYVPTRLVLDYIRDCPTCATAATDADATEMDENIQEALDIAEIPYTFPDAQINLDPTPTTDDPAPLVIAPTSNAIPVFLLVPTGGGLNAVPSIPVTSTVGVALTTGTCLVCGQYSPSTEHWTESFDSGVSLCEILDLPYNKSISRIIQSWSSCWTCSQLLKRMKSMIDEIKSIQKQLKRNKTELKRLVQSSKQYYTTATDSLQQPSESDLKTVHALLTFAKSNSDSLENQNESSNGDVLVPDNNAQFQNCNEWEPYLKRNDELEAVICVANNNGQIDVSAEAVEIPVDSLPSSALQTKKSTKRPNPFRFDLHLLKCTSVPNCRRRFTSQKTLDAHVLVDHQKKKIFSCASCEKTFMTPSGLWDHVKLKHLQLKDKLCCSVCEKTFEKTNEEELKIHEVTHKSNKFSCVIGSCTEEFPSLLKLKRHVGCYHEGRPYECAVCRAGFDSKVRLNRHATVHSDLKPHQCEVCGKSYGTKNLLWRHQSWHKIPEGKTFQCSHCGKTFRVLKYLRQHQKRNCTIPPKRRRRKKRRVDKSLESVKRS